MLLPRFLVAATLCMLVAASGAFARPAKITVDQAFDDESTGEYPQAGVTIGPDGGLWGTTRSGGRNGYGSLYRRGPGGELVVMHWFDAETGASSGPLTALPDGSLWGVSALGGRRGHGAVFRYDMAAKTLRIVHAFNQSDGAEPQGRLLLATDGYLYGTTERGGAFFRGTIYRIDPDRGAMRSLYSFSPADLLLGMLPKVGLVEGPNGLLYGTTSTSMSRAAAYAGSLFSLDPVTNHVSVVHQFDYRTEGKRPSGELFMTAAGRIYGVVRATSAYGGSVYTIAAGGDLTILYALPEALGSPRDGVILASDGSLYGSTISGSKRQTLRGTIYRLSTDGSRFGLMTNFFKDGEPLGRSPTGELVEFAGALWGVTFGGGRTDDGTLYRLTPPAPAAAEAAQR